MTAKEIRCIPCYSVVLGRGRTRLFGTLTPFLLFGRTGWEQSGRQRWRSIAGQHASVVVCGVWYVQKVAVRFDFDWRGGKAQVSAWTQIGTFAFGTERATAEKPCFIPSRFTGTYIIRPLWMVINRGRHRHEESWHEQSTRLRCSHTQLFPASYTRKYYVEHRLGVWEPSMTLPCSQGIHAKYGAWNRVLIQHIMSCKQAEVKGDPGATSAPPVGTFFHTCGLRSAYYVLLQQCHLQC